MIRDYDVIVQELKCKIFSPIFLENSNKNATGNLRIITREIWLILPEATAFGVRLSHASRKKLDSLRTAQ